MKKLILALSALFAFSAMADDARSITVEVEPGTKALKIRLVSVLSTSCPQTNLTFVKNPESLGVIELVPLDSLVSSKVKGITDNVSEQCSNEVIRVLYGFDRPPVHVCLSYGEDAGTALIATAGVPVSSTVEIVLPPVFRAESVEQLK